MGVSGCGKSTVAGLVAGHLGWDFQEGDDLHSAQNIEKMASSQPPSALLDSQLACLEPPEVDEHAITIGVGARPAELAAEVIRALALRPGPVDTVGGSQVG